MRISIADAVRYMGAGEGNAEVRRMAEETAAELEKKITPRYTWRAFRTEVREDGVFLPEAGETLTGALARNMLAECDTAVILLCTLGAAFEAMQRTEEARDMAKAVVLDACGSAWVEAGCDEAENEIAARFPGAYRTDRFSPGYGDLPLENQEWILRVLNAGRRLGVTETASHLLIPSKSVTAVIGLSDRPQGAKIRGCAYCALKEGCAFRERGTRCGV